MAEESVPQELAAEIAKMRAEGGTYILEPVELSRRCGVPQNTVALYLEEQASKPNSGITSFESDPSSSLPLGSWDDWDGAGSDGGLKRYRLATPDGRDVRAVVCVHGMNTFGAWQEELAWLVQLGFGYSIPTFLFKYGRILLSPFLEWRQERYVRQFVHRFDSKVAELNKGAYSEPPDIVAHSFGTWIVARALETSSVRYGRVVLTGSIVRPDFPWSRYVKQGRVKAVLCHCGMRDIWVRAAPFFIPNSGPSGVVGFSSAMVRHVVASDYGHSDFFDDRFYRANFEAVWIPFLTSSDAQPSAATQPTRMGAWHAHAGHSVGTVIKVLLLGILSVGGLVVAAALVLGCQAIARVLEN